MDNVYLLYGEEKQLIDQKIKEIIDQYLTTDIANSIIKYDLTETSIDEVLDDASMPSLLTDLKMIIANDCFFLTSSNKKIDFEHNIDNLIRYINNPNPNTILILTTNSSLDERKKIVKALKKKAKVLEYKKIDHVNLFNAVKDRFTTNKYKIDNETINSLIEKVGYNLHRINNEIDKLMLYKLDDKIITKEDIIELVPRTVEENIFDLIEAAVNKDKDKIFTIYDELLNQGEEPIKIIVLLANQFRIIYQTKILYQQGYTEKDIASELGIHPYRIKLAYQKGRLFDDSTLIKYLKELANLDIGIKTGQIDKNIGLELFLLQL